MTYFQRNPKQTKLYAKELTERISRGLSPITREITYGGTYDREKTERLVYIGKYGSISLPFDEALVFGKKLDELDGNKRYRKKILFYLFS